MCPRRLENGSSPNTTSGTGSGYGCSASESGRRSLFQRAPVGHDTMHSPQDTQEESPIGALLSKAMPAVTPLPMRPRTKFSRMSLQPRMQRSHSMQASKPTPMLIDGRPRRDGPFAAASELAARCFFRSAPGAPNRLSAVPRAGRWMIRHQ